MTGLPALSSPSLSALPVPSRAQESVGVGKQWRESGGDRGNIIYSRSPSSKLQTVLWKKSRQPDSVQSDGCCLGEPECVMWQQRHTHKDEYMHMYEQTQARACTHAHVTPCPSSFPGGDSLLSLGHVTTPGFEAAMFKAPRVETARAGMRLHSPE